MHGPGVGNNFFVSLFHILEVPVQREQQFLLSLFGTRTPYSPLFGPVP